jgi:mevalonate kinase
MSEIAQFFAKGKLLLTAEYFVLDGSMALALPSRLGQRLRVETLPSKNDNLSWRSLDWENKAWFEGNFKLSDFSEKGTPSITGTNLSTILRAVFKNRTHPEQDLLIETILDFPQNWGLGSSSTLISCLCQWTGADPYQVLDDSIGGSGYDIACSQADGPIFFQRKGTERRHHSIHYQPDFLHNLYFVHLGEKQSTQEAIKNYLQLEPSSFDDIKHMTSLTQAIASAHDLGHFEHIIAEHENFVAAKIQQTRAKDQFFSDYWGEIKSLGAWGGDFVLATSVRDHGLTQAYFAEKGFPTVLSYKDLF